MRDMIKTDRDASIELARIIAICMVIGVHINLPVDREGLFDFSVNFLRNCISDGVGVFFLIYGYYAYGRRNPNYLSLYRRALLRIVLPLLLFCLFVFCFGDYLVTGHYPVLSVRTPGEWKAFFGDIVCWNTPVKYSPHIWYLFAYLILVSSYPVINEFVILLDSESHYERCFIVSSIVLLLWNDASSNQLLTFGYHGIDTIVPTATWAIWGHILHKKLDSLRTDSGIVISISPMLLILLFLLLNVLRTVGLAAALSADSKSTIVGYWYSCPGLLSATLVLAFSKTVLSSQRRPSVDNHDAVVRNLIRFVAAQTYGIYFIHELIVQRMIHFHLLEELLSSIPVKGIVGETLYYVIGITFVYLLTLTIVIVAKHCFSFCTKRLNSYSYK